LENPKEDDPKILEVDYDPSVGGCFVTNEIVLKFMKTLNLLQKVIVDNIDFIRTALDKFSGWIDSFEGNSIEAAKMYLIKEGEKIVLADSKIEETNTLLWRQTLCLIRD
jgi:hypothetical protein